MTVKAVTTAGNIASAAISPDGSYVAYATTDKGQLSSLWIEQLATSTRHTVIPPAEARYHALTFSPDGTYIYYVLITKESHARTLYRVSVLGGPTKKLLEDVQTAISFSPDGTQFVFRRTLDDRREAGLFIANADGSGQREIAAIPYPESLADPAWSPDGKLIASAAGNAQTVASMYVLGVSTEDWSMRRLSAQPWQWIGQMAWLDDSSGLVMLARERWSSPGQVWQLSYPSGEARRVTNDSNMYNRLSLAAQPNVMAALQSKQVSNVWIIPANDASRARQITSGAGGYRGDLSWTPDGRVVYDSELGSATSISRMDSDGSNPKQLTGELTGRAYVGRSTVSPDGRYIAFTSDLTGERHIWLMNADGSNPVQLTNGNGEDNPQYSPDGRWVFYTSLERAGARMPTIGRVSVDDGKLLQLTNEFTAYPTVSPDGKMYACLYSEGFRDPWRMAIYPFDGGRPIKVFPQVVSAQTVRWTPDGRSLTYIDNPIGESAKILIQPVDGGQPKQVAEFEADRIFGFDWSRDGKYIACVRGLWTTNIVLIRDFK
jgi:Tol biopolymer transport system component